jgi:hypothetical protein
MSRSLFDDRPEDPNLTQTDIAAFDLTIAVMRQKMIPFLGRGGHASHDALDVCEHIAAHLQQLIDANNRQRARRGLPPLRSFQEARLREEEGFDA